MLEPKFNKIDKNTRLFITKKYICTGHFALSRTAMPLPNFPKPLFNQVINLQFGNYVMGISGGVTDDDLEKADNTISAVIPKRDNYKLISNHPSGVKFIHDTDRILAYVYDFGESKIGVSTDYVPLMRLGHCFAKDKTSPIIVLAEDNIESELLAVIMPMRL